jgi:3-oxosteroid 1-dehydrogenase
MRTSRDRSLIRATLMLLLTLLGKKMYAMGNAIAIGLRKGLIDAGVRSPTRPS